MVQGNIGPYKVIYTKDKPNVVYGKMFDSIEVALNFAHKLSGRWLLSQKIGHDKDDYAWKVLPYGAHVSYSIGIKADRLRVVIIVLLVIALIYFGKNMFNFKPKALY